MSNFLEETREIINGSGHNESHIIFIGSEDSGHECTWSEFEVLADFKYDNGYGGQKIPTDLIIVFDDGTKLSREEYDGSEWWEYHAPFVRPTDSLPIKTLMNGDSWATVADMQKAGGKYGDD